MFTTGHRKTESDTKVKVGSVVVSFVIDYGSSVNVIDRKMWENLKKVENKV